MTEHAEQVALIKWFRIAYPKMIMFAIPNAAKRSVTLASYMKSEGLISGVSDLFLMSPNKHFHGLFVEMKATKGKVSDAQREFIESAIANGYAAYVCFGFDDARKVVTQYLQDI